MQNEVWPKLTNHKKFTFLFPSLPFMCGDVPLIGAEFRAKKKKVNFGRIRSSESGISRHTQLSVARFIYTIWLFTNNGIVDNPVWRPEPGV
jgi:hypothetical protein